MSKLLTTLFIIVAASTSARSVQQDPQRPQPSEGLTIVDYMPPPATLEQLWDKTPIVLRGRTLRSTVRAVPVGSVRVRPSTVHTVEVLEVLKNTSVFGVSAGGEIEVNQPGGTIQKNGRTITAHTTNFPVFRNGHELIFFLTPSRETTGFSVPYGPAGAYLVEGEQVLIPTITSHYAAFRGLSKMPKDAFQTLLRELSSRPKS